MVGRSVVRTVRIVDQADQLQQGVVVRMLQGVIGEVPPQRRPDVLTRDLSE